MRLQRPVIGALHCWRARWTRRLRLAPRSSVRLATPPPENDNAWADAEHYRQMRVYFGG